MIGSVRPGYGVEDIDVDVPLVMELFGAESEYMNVFVNKEGLNVIEAGFVRSDLGGLGDFVPGEIYVSGKLVNGDCFAGIDSFKVIGRSEANK